MFEMLHHAKFGQNRFNRGCDITIFRFFQDGGRPPSWIRNACVGTTHEGHLVVFITVQNLVGIDAVVLIICAFFDFASLADNKIVLRLCVCVCLSVCGHSHGRITSSIFTKLDTDV